MFLRGGEIAGRTDRFSSVNSVVPCYRVGWRKKNETNHRSRPEGEDYACLKFAVIPSTRALAVVRHVTRFELCNSRLSSPFWTTIVFMTDEACPPLQRRNFLISTIAYFDLLQRMFTSQT